MKCKALYILAAKYNEIEPYSWKTPGISPSLTYSSSHFDRTLSIALLSVAPVSGFVMNASEPAAMQSTSAIINEAYSKNIPPAFAVRAIIGK
jgi:hypothetical protein